MIMIRAKNYETMSKFVKVMPKIVPWPLFSEHGVYVRYKENKHMTDSRRKAILNSDRTTSCE